MCGCALSVFHSDCTLCIWEFLFSFVALGSVLISFSFIHVSFHFARSHILRAAEPKNVKLKNVLQYLFHQPPHITKYGCCMFGVNNMIEWKLSEKKYHAKQYGLYRYKSERSIFGSQLVFMQQWETVFTKTVRNFDIQPLFWAPIEMRGAVFVLLRNLMKFINDFCCFTTFVRAPRRVESANGWTRFWKLVKGKSNASRGYLGWRWI